MTNNKKINARVYQDKPSLVMSCIFKNRDNQDIFYPDDWFISSFVQRNRKPFKQSCHNSKSYGRNMHLSERIKLMKSRQSSQYAQKAKRITM